MGRIILLLLFSMPAHAPGVTWNLVATGWTDVMDCDPTMRPRCYRQFSYPSGYRWEHD